MITKEEFLHLLAEKMSALFPNTSSKSEFYNRAVDIWDFIEPHLAKDMSEISVLYHQIEELKNQVQAKDKSIEAYKRDIELKDRDYSALIDVRDGLQKDIRMKAETMTNLNTALNHLLNENDALRKAINEGTDSRAEKHAIEFEKEAKSAQEFRAWNKSREHWIRHYAGLAMQAAVTRTTHCVDVNAIACIETAKTLCDELGIK